MPTLAWACRFDSGHAGGNAPLTAVNQFAPAISNSVGEISLFRSFFRARQNLAKRDNESRAPPIESTRIQVPIVHGVAWHPSHGTTGKSNQRGPRQIARHLHVESSIANGDKLLMAYRLIDKQQIWTGGKVSLEVHHLADEEGHKLSKEVVIHPGAAVILPFLPDGNVILIRNRRYAVGQILLELPAGTLNKGETPMNAAGRELLEETGYLASRIKPLGSFFSSPGVMSEKMYAFAAYDLEKQKSALEEGEEIELFPVSLTDAVLMIQDGQIQDGKTIATVLMYDRFFREDR